jgi:Zn ribbon nucleic-acid-binding protein
MKHIVVMSELKAADIRPPALLSRFRELSIAESAVYFGDLSKLVDVACPACECPDKIAVFEKNGFEYHQCAECGSVFVSLRPSEEALAEYYQNSQASKYRDHLSRETADARRFHVLRSRFSWVGRIYDETGNPKARAYADIGTTHPFIFDEVKRLHLFDELYSINPAFATDGEHEAREVAIRQAPLQGLGVVTAFEQLEHQFSALTFLKTAHDMLTEGGLLFLTTRTTSGFDLQVLWDKAPYIFVPEHLNLLSIEGITRLIDRAGFCLLELSTPGQLDVELVLRATLEDPSIRLPRFVEYFLNQRDIETHADFQSFLQKNRLSSHVRIAAKKE